MKIKQCFSHDLSILHGVSQGSIGSVFFLKYINDLCNLDLGEDCIISFADDTFQRGFL